MMPNRFRNELDSLAGMATSRMSPRYATHAAIGQPRSVRLTALALLMAGMAAVPARADISDTVHPYLQAIVTHDDNVLRLPDSDPGINGFRGDTIRQLEAGVLLDQPIGRQQVNGHVKFTDTQYNNYTSLNYQGKDVLANWDWQIGNHLQGKLGASYLLTLVPFTDFHSDERNLQSERREYFEGAWTFHPSWRIRTSASTDRFRYSLHDQQYNDRTENLGMLGLDYITAGGNSIGVEGRHLKGNFTTANVYNGISYSSNYVQNEVLARIYWRPTEATDFQLLAGKVNRKDASPILLGNTGQYGQLDVTWTPRSKLRLTGSAYRNYAPVASTIFTSSLNKGVSAGALWSATAKLNAKASYLVESRDFGVASFLGLSDAKDVLRSASVSLLYTPLRNLQLSARVYHETQSANVFEGGYRATGTMISGNIQF